MEPDLDRLAFSPCPEASLASSGTSAFSSLLAGHGPKLPGGSGGKG